MDFIPSAYNNLYFKTQRFLIKKRKNMKTSIFILLTFILLACGNKNENMEISDSNEIKVESINDEMGCENCGMNLMKFISTSHALKMDNGESHFYCSINCSSIALQEIKGNVISVYGIDYSQTKYYPVNQLHYVIGSSLNGTMTQVSKFAFAEIDKANIFLSTFSGKEIVKYDDALKMSLEEIESRKK